MRGFSIIICTHNRLQLLQECLYALFGQFTEELNFEVIVVINGHFIEVENLVQHMKHKVSNLSYVTEPSIGLSIAKNTGVRCAKYEWVVFLDDDAKVHLDYIQRIEYNIQMGDFNAFGGMFYPWYITKRPRWIPENFGAMQRLLPKRGVLSNDQFIAGGISAYQKRYLEMAGGFSVRLGMRGNLIGYGEENEIQKRIQALGAIVGFDPEWRMDHLVSSYKLKVNWHLKRAFAKGRDSNLNTVYGYSERLKDILYILISTPVRTARLMVRWLSSKDYYWQNCLIDSLSPSLRRLGKFF